MLIVPDTRGLTVHHLLRTDHLAAERLADRLMPEAHAEDRNASRQPLDCFERDAGLVRRARAGRENNVRRVESFNLVDLELVVADHAHVRAQLAEVLHEVEGKRIVVVDDQHHDANIRLILLIQIPRVRRSPDHLTASASSAARSSARALCWVSSHSERGSESATMPAAACTCRRRSLTTAVRIAIA